MKIYTKKLVFLGFVILFSATIVVAQKAAKVEKKNMITIESVVKDENGNPVKGAIIYGNEGAVISKTDASGNFKISVADQTGLLIESDGYEPAVFKSGEIKSMKVFLLKASSFQYGSKDVVNVAFGKVKRGDLVNSVSVINPDKDILQYNNIQSIDAALSGRVPGLLGSSNIRGLGSPLFVVDGIPRDISNINLSEVDQITVLKDINAAILYGNAAVNGVILVTTKRGQAYKKQISVTGYYGISKPSALPKYLSSADYMELNNEARVNDGLSPQYTTASIANYRTGNQYRYPSVDYYSDTYLKSVKPFSRVSTEISGGNDIATYYSNLGWDQGGSLLNFGQGKSGKTNKFNGRGNIDLKINNWVKTSIDAAAVFSNSKGPVGTDYWSSASTLKPNLIAPLLPFSLIPGDNALLTARKKDINGMYLPGGTSSVLTNPIADGYLGGYKEFIERLFSFNNRIDFDLKGLTEGLAFHTNVSLDFYSSYNQSINNGYSVYQPVWGADDTITSLTKYNIDTNTGVQNVTDNYYTRRIGFYGLLDYDRTFGDVHHITGSLLGFWNKYKAAGDNQGLKSGNLGLRLSYSFNKKYLVDFSSAVVNSVKLPEGNRAAFSPSLGLAWLISSEDFMSEVKFVNYLKLRISGGILNSDTGIPNFFLYDATTTNSYSYSWYEATYSNSGTVSVQGANPLLAWEKRKELNFGFEGLFFDRMIGLDANIFTSSYSDQITKHTVAYPSYYTYYIPYENYEDNAYRGVELGLSFNRSFGDLSFTIGANILYANSEVKKLNELYADKYQYRTGKPIDARFGLVADGFFRDQTDINNHAQQLFGNVKPGDIKYVDQNNDGVVDANDQIQIGRSQSPFSYGLNLRLSYKNFTLFAEGIGRIGADSYIGSNNYYWVDGDDKYSEYVLNRWTPATATTATFPRLSSIANTNNFQNSTFWLYKDNYFSISRIQLTYDMPEKVAGMLLMRNLSFYLAASNLPLISKHRDIKELNIGSEPQYRSFSLGVKTMF
jgi:TonB-linked SusC/RagA family outer membrane protein